jgi:hypothetical protein
MNTFQKVRDALNAISDPKPFCYFQGGTLCVRFKKSDGTKDQLRIRFLYGIPLRDDEAEVSIQYYGEPYDDNRTTFPEAECCEAYCKEYARIKNEETN